jgi:DNA-binding transcriptional MerR regulator
VDEHIGVPLKRAAEIIGVSRTRLINWGREGILRPRASIDIGVQHRWLYSVDELAAGRIIRRVEEAGVDIRHLTWLVAQYRTTTHQNPLLSYVWAVDAAAHCVYLSEDGEDWMDGTKVRQYVMPEVIDLEQIRAEVRREVHRRLGRPGRIVRNRRGKQVFEGTRVPVDGVMAWLEDGATTDRILAAYPSIEEADIDAVRRRVIRAS